MFEDKRPTQRGISRGVDYPKKFMTYLPDANLKVLCERSEAWSVCSQTSWEVFLTIVSRSAIKKTAQYEQMAELVVVNSCNFIWNAISTMSSKCPWCSGSGDSTIQFWLADVIKLIAFTSILLFVFPCDDVFLFCNSRQQSWRTYKPNPQLKTTP